VKQHVKWDRNTRKRGPNNSCVSRLARCHQIRYSNDTLYPSSSPSNGVSRDGQTFVLPLRFHFLRVSQKLDKKNFLPLARNWILLSFKLNEKFYDAGSRAHTQPHRSTHTQRIKLLTKNTVSLRNFGFILT
jgi:hypothetical protein